jgi:hypothetical protein
MFRRYGGTAVRRYELCFFRGHLTLLVWMVGPLGLARPQSFTLLSYRRTAVPPSRHHVTLSTSANPNTVSDITPFIVKNAASSRERSPGRTSWCS